MANLQQEYEAEVTVFESQFDSEVEKTEDCLESCNIALLQIKDRVHRLSSSEFAKDQPTGDNDKIGLILRIFNL